jgi:deoxyhypusine synthase
MSQEKNPFLSGRPIAPEGIQGTETVADLVEQTFFAYNAGRIREACRLLNEKILAEDVTVGLSLSGALTPAGLGRSCIIPLIENGFVDWIVSTGANLYHDTHFGIGLDLHKGTPFVDDRLLKEKEVVRIYDVLFSFDVLMETDKFFYEVLSLPEFQKEMGTAELHHHIGKYIAEREKALGLGRVSLLSAAYRQGVPVYTSSPGDSSIGMNIAALNLKGIGPKINPSIDVNETTAIVYYSKKSGSRNGLVMMGGGSPKNFVLQTEPQIQEVLGLEESGHDFFLQVTDARPDTGGLSGATPSEAVSWGKVDPERLPDSVVAYVDSTIALPILTAYVMSRRTKRPQRRLYDRRAELLSFLKKDLPEKFQAQQI